MKLLAIFVAVLGFGPILLEDSLNVGRYAPAPTPVFPTKTYDPSAVLNAGKELLQVPPTSGALLDHNTAGESAISISTASQLTPDPAVAGPNDTILNLDSHILQYHWSNLHHWRPIDPGWVITFCLFLQPFLTIGAAILLERHLSRRSLQSEPVTIVSTPLGSRRTPKCQVLHTRTTNLSAFRTRGRSEAVIRIANATPNSLEKAHGLRSPRLLLEGPKTTARAGSLKGAVDQPVVLKQAHRVVAWVTLYSVEGLLCLDLCSTNPDRAGAVRWNIKFYPRDQYNPTPNARVATNDHVFIIIFHGISGFHPWAPHLSAVLEIPREMITGSNEEADQTNATGSASHSAVVLAETVPNGELGTSMEISPSNGSSETCGIDEKEYNKPTTPVIPSPTSTSNHDGPVSEAAGLPLPRSRAGSLEFESQSAEQNLATSAEQGGRLEPSADVKMTSGENRVDVGDAQSGTYFAEEDVPATYAREENEPEKQNKKSKAHRGGKRTARMKQKQALREAAAEAAEAPEAPEAGPSGSN